MEFLQTLKDKIPSASSIMDLPPVQAVADFYETLPEGKQKAMRIGSTVLITLLFLGILGLGVMNLTDKATRLSKLSSMYYMTAQTVQNLKSLATGSGSFTPSVKALVQSAMTRSSINLEKLQNYSEAAGAPAGKGAIVPPGKAAAEAPATETQDDSKTITFTVEDINLRQIEQFGTAIKNAPAGPSIRKLKINVTKENDHRFDLSLVLVSG